jgi:hypothetical protein
VHANGCRVEIAGRRQAPRGFKSLPPLNRGVCLLAKRFRVASRRRPLGAPVAGARVPRPLWGASGTHVATPANKTRQHLQTGPVVVDATFVVSPGSKG